MAKNKAEESYATEDYSVRYKLFTQSTPTTDQLYSAYNEYRKFLAGLETLGLLDAKTKTGLNELLTFKQWKAGDASIFGRVNAFGDFWEALQDYTAPSFLHQKNTIRERRAQGGQTPDFSLFSFNLLRGIVLQLPVKQFARVNHNFKHIEKSLYSLSLENGEVITFDTVLGVSVDVALKVLEEGFRGFREFLTRVGLNSSDSRVVRLLAYNAFIDKDYAFVATAYNLISELERTWSEPTRVFASLIDNETDLFVGFAATSERANTTEDTNNLYSSSRYRSRKSTLPGNIKSHAKLRFTVDEIQNLDGLPSVYVLEALIPSEKSSLGGSSFLDF
jgi:hypothetical protein